MITSDSMPYWAFGTYCIIFVGFVAIDLTLTTFVVQLKCNRWVFSWTRPLNLRS